MFKSEGWSISTNIAWREQLCSLNKNTLISFNLPGSIKIRIWSNGNVLWWDRLWSRSDRHEKKGGWSASVWVQGYDLELLQLVRSRLGNIMCSKRHEFSWLFEYTQWPESGVLDLFENLWDTMETTLRSSRTLISIISARSSKKNECNYRWK